MDSDVYNTLNRLHADPYAILWDIRNEDFHVYQYVFSILSHTSLYILEVPLAASLYCCPDCPSCLAHMNSIDWALRAAIKKASLKHNFMILCFMKTDTFLSGCTVFLPNICYDENKNQKR